VETRRFALVSWYGRADEGYDDRGGRVSFVDVSRMQSRRWRDGTTTSTTTYYPYEHVLLVDERFCTLPSIHVGGIEHVNGTLYVADSRKDQHKILEFDLVGGLYDVSTGEGASDAFLGHRYVLRMSSSFRSSITPSFLSYDADRGEFVIGTYARCGGVRSMSDRCFDRPENRLVWLRRDDPGPSGNATSGNATSGNATSGEYSRAWHYFSEMQGAASVTVSDATVVWISSSYGHLHAVCAPLARPASVDLVKEEVNIFRFPPGLEDLHIERWTVGDRYMWMVTEFGTRRVFATRLEYLLR